MTLDSFKVIQIKKTLMGKTKGIFYQTLSLEIGCQRLLHSGRALAFSSHGKGFESSGCLGPKKRKGPKMMTLIAKIINLAR
jgi:hypothetical protein